MSDDPNELRDLLIAACVVVALVLGVASAVAFLAGCYGSHEDITPELFDAGTECPEGWVRGNAAQPGVCLRIAPGSPADWGPQ